MSTGRSTARSPRRPLPDAPRWRLFVAAPLPEIAAERVGESLAEVRTRHPLVAWAPPNKLHLTLVFMGSTDPSRVGYVADAMAATALRHGPFEVATGDGGGRAGGRRGGVAWLRIATGGHHVSQLSLDLDAAIGSNTYDAKNAPRPHLTVARKVTEAALADVRAIGSTLTFGWTVDRIVLFRSHPDPGGSRYELLTQAALGA